MWTANRARSVLTASGAETPQSSNSTSGKFPSMCLRRRKEPSPRHSLQSALAISQQEISFVFPLSPIDLLLSRAILQYLHKSRQLHVRPLHAPRARQPPSCPCSRQLRRRVHVRQVICQVRGLLHKLLLLLEGVRRQILLCS